MTQPPVSQASGAASPTSAAKVSGEWVRRGTVIYLTLQSLGALLWWVALYASPEVRHAFLPLHFPDAALLAFGLPDLLFFLGAGAWAAWQLRRSAQTGYVALCIHSGAAMYAALYCWALWWQTGAALWGALLMTPCLIVQPLLVWHLRPRTAVIMSLNSP